MSRLSEQFLQNADWQRALRAALAELGLTTRASRASVFMVTEDPSKKLVASLHSEWTEVGVTPQMPNPAWENLDLQSAGLGRWIDELSAGRVIHDRIHNLPEPEQQALSDRGVVSLCVLPVRSANRLLGFLAFEDCHRSRIWSDTEVHTLRVAAETLSAAVRRSEADKRLRISEMRFRSLLGLGQRNPPR